MLPGKLQLVCAFAVVHMKKKKEGRRDVVTGIVSEKFDNTPPPRLIRRFACFELNFRLSRSLEFHEICPCFDYLFFLLFNYYYYCA